MSLEKRLILTHLKQKTTSRKKRGRPEDFFGRTVNALRYRALVCGLARSPKEVRQALIDNFAKQQFKEPESIRVGAHRERSIVDQILKFLLEQGVSYQAVVNCEVEEVIVPPHRLDDKGLARQFGDAFTFELDRMISIENDLDDDPGRWDLLNVDDQGEYCYGPVDEVMLERFREFNRARKTVACF